MIKIFKNFKDKGYKLVPAGTKVVFLHDYQVVHIQKEYGFYGRPVIANNILHGIEGSSGQLYFR